MLIGNFSVIPIDLEEFIESDDKLRRKLDDNIHNIPRHLQRFHLFGNVWVINEGETFGFYEEIGDYNFRKIRTWQTKESILYL